MRYLLILLCASFLIVSCDNKSPQSPAPAAAISPAEPAQHQATQPNTITKQTPPEKSSKPLDLTWHRKPNTESVHIEAKQQLPNFFKSQKPEPKKAAVGGRVLMKDDPNAAFIDNIHGAELSVEVRIP